MNLSEIYARNSLESPFTNSWESYPADFADENAAHANDTLHLRSWSSNAQTSVEGDDAAGNSDLLVNIVLLVWFSLSVVVTMFVANLVSSL